MSRTHPNQVPDNQAMPMETFHLDSKRLKRVKRIQTIQHVIAAFLLLTAAVPHLSHPEEGLLLPIAEIVTAAALIVSTVLEKLGRLHGRAAWLEYAAAAMTFVEAVAQLQKPHHVAFYVLSFIPPVILLTFALLDSRIHHAIAMTADEERFQVRLRLIRRRRVAWTDIRSWRMHPKAIELALADGTTSMWKLDDVLNVSEALDWAREQFARRSLPETLSATHELPGREGETGQGERDESAIA
jgi:hypothetical protein